MKLQDALNGSSAFIEQKVVAFAEEFIKTVMLNHHPLLLVMHKTIHSVYIILQGISQGVLDGHG